MGLYTSPPLLLKRPEPPAQPEGASGGIQDFYAGHLTRDELDELRRAGRNGSGEFERAEGNTAEPKQVSHDDEHTDPEPVPAKEHKKLVGPKPDCPWYSGALLFCEKCLTVGFLA
ncbi:hypothetical protein EDB81DRAFT_766881 [Dactylonectria macrodidyma]|uniref:Uncharacterized protein n=1 Tax=Dactylonectria macrodidyma TaxID=307937 RepID=A0A9P9IH92_9HYPO|nr:hypothetical protein EDB81DRAFT_766881 [Dactylonectria macrodidyma]